MKEILVELAPCGIYCGSCPSFKKTCHGCASQNKDQKRKSKWQCKLRVCCYEKKKLEFCSECTEYPCDKINRKLFDSHRGDKRYKYRWDTKDNLKMLKKLGPKKYLEYQRKRWTCPDCGGLVFMYVYECSECQRKVNV